MLWGGRVEAAEAFHPSGEARKCRDVATLEPFRAETLCTLLQQRGGGGFSGGRRRREGLGIAQHFTSLSQSSVGQMLHSVPKSQTPELTMLSLGPASWIVIGLKPGVHGFGDLSQDSGW